MMRRSLVAPSIAAALLVAVPQRVSAQATPGALDSAERARAQSITVGHYCQSARRVLASRQLMSQLAADSTAVRVHVATICDPLLASFSLLALIGEGPAPLAAVARLHTQGSPESRSRIFDAMSEFRALVQTDEMIPVVERSLDAQNTQRLVRVTSTVQTLLTVAAQDRALKRLSRYERKLGPTSARLNGIEVLLNYAAQRWIPTFRATPQDGPSAYELVASYTPGYVARSGDRATPVSAAEFGVRRYLFGERFGQSGPRGVLLPTYWSAGVLTASDRNGALVWPWEGRSRTGGYVSWGSIKVAYVPERSGRWLVSKQFQAIPFVF
jgi:hypothetical protein